MKNLKYQKNLKKNRFNKNQLNQFNNNNKNNNKATKIVMESLKLEFLVCHMMLLKKT